MPKYYEPKPYKTYANKKNAIKAVEKIFSQKYNKVDTKDLRYIVVPNEEGRYYPIFIGHKALQLGIHFDFLVIMNWVFYLFINKI